MLYYVQSGVAFSKDKFFIFSSVQSLSHVWLFATPWTAECHTSLSIPTPGVYSNACSLSQWCHPAISSSVVPFSYCPNLSQDQGLFQWINSSHEVAKVLEFLSASVLPMSTQDWSPLGWTGWISLQFKGLSRVFSNTTVQKHQFFGTLSYYYLLSQRSEIRQLTIEC